jgi:hypothetical protein
MQFLKMFGLGILYALLFPFLCVALALFAVYGVIVFLVEFIIMVVHFFSGKKLFPPFPEDQKAYQILLQLQQQQLAAANPQQPQTNVYVQQNYYTPHGQPIPGAAPQPSGTPIGQQPQSSWQPLGNPEAGQLPPQQPGQIPPQPSYTQQPNQIPQQQRPANPFDVIDTNSEDKK